MLRGIQLSEEFRKRYKLLALIGKGGAGQVFKAVQLSLQREVAVKFLSPELFSDEESLARFMQEADIAARLHHPNVVQVLEKGNTQGVPYIVYEFIEGIDLGTYIQRNGNLPVEEAVRIVKEIARGLYFAHTLNILHRDLKSENILLHGPQKLVKITDFGIAKVVGDSRIKTETGVVLGTPSYLPPERVKGKPATVLSDLYSLGVLFYEMLCGRLPFWGQSPMEIALKHVKEPVPPISGRGVDVPEVVEYMVVKRMLAKEPSRRFQSMRHFLLALDEVESHLARSGGGRRTKEELLRKIDSYTGEARKRSEGKELGTIRKRSGTHRVPGGRDEARRKLVQLEIQRRLEQMRRRKRLEKILTAIALVVVAGFVSVVGYYWYRSAAMLPSDDETSVSGGADCYDVLGLRTESGISTADVSWESTVPYHSRIVYWRSDAPYSRDEAEGEPGVTRTHHVRVEELDEGSEYVFRIVFPDGTTSLENRFKTKYFRVVEEGVTWLSPTAFRLSCHVNVPMWTRMVLRNIVTGERFEKTSRRPVSTMTLERGGVSPSDRFEYKLYFYDRPPEGDEAVPSKVADWKPVEPFSRRFEIMHARLARFLRRERPMQALAQIVKVASGAGRLSSARARSMCAEIVVETRSRAEELLDGLRKQWKYVLGPYCPPSLRWDTTRLLQTFLDIDAVAALMGTSERCGAADFFGRWPCRLSGSAVPSPVATSVPVTFVGHYRRHRGWKLGADASASEVRTKVRLPESARSEAPVGELKVTVRGLGAWEVLEVRIGDIVRWRMHGVAGALERTFHLGFEPKTAVDEDGAVRFVFRLRPLVDGVNMPDGARISSVDMLFHRRMDER